MLPTPVFFYGMEPGQEISVDLERGKTLIVRFVAVERRPTRMGPGTVFFELNGQPRECAWRTAARSPSGRRSARPSREIPQHVGAPMPGTVATISAAVGRKVARGDVLRRWKP